ncbi:MAG: CorA family divalent cation transporter [Flavobacteriales bacterium]
MSNFLNHTTLTIYSLNSFSETSPKELSEVKIKNTDNTTWVNTYGINYLSDFNKVISQNELDDFLRLLIKENKHRNKTIELEDSIFLAINTIHLNNNQISTEQMMFIVGENYVWSIQEKEGDYFQEIRFRLKENKGLVRKKSADYLLYLLLDAIIDNYASVYEKIHQEIASIIDLENDNPDQSYVIKIEEKKGQLFHLKRALTSLRDAIFKLENTELENVETRYFIEAKEQVHYLIDDIDFDLAQLESKLNLVFNLQNNRLNTVMKTLTIFSVIFIPLTFLAGIYGMNFDNLPGSKAENGFYIFVATSIFITILSIYMINRKNWFK